MNRNATYFCTETMRGYLIKMCILIVKLPMGKAQSRIMREIEKLSSRIRRIEKVNRWVQRRLDIMACPAWRGRVMNALGGERRMSSWERRNASEAAQIAAAHRNRPPQWWIDKHHARLKAEAERTRYFARPDDWCPNTYIGTPEYALEPIKRGPSLLRGCSIARRPARSREGMDFMPTLVFIPSELRGESAPLPPAHVKPAPRKRSAKHKSKSVPSPLPISGEATHWEHITTEQAIAEIFGGGARASP